MSSVTDVAAVTMNNEMRRIETVAHNISNASTTGFKRQTTTTFAQAMQTGAVEANEKAAAPTLAVPNTAQATDFAAGRLSLTGSNTHLALSGAGFFVVRSGAQISYTRAGTFERNADGNLVTPQGAVLQGEGGDISLRSADFRIEADGTVIEEQRPIGRIRVVDFEDRSALTRASDGSFLAADAAARNVDVPGIRQGYLETSNVDLGTEMVQLMEATRRFELGQRLIVAHGDMMDRTIRRIGDLQS